MADPDTDVPKTTVATTSAAKATSLSDRGIKYLASEIDASSCKGVVEWIMEEGFKGKQERLTLIISSYGGAIFPAFSVIDAMLGSAIPVDTIGLGYIASAGLLIFIHGSHRIVTPNTYILAHQYSGGKWGKQHELLASRKEQDWLMERFIDMHVRQSRGRLTREQVKTVLMGPSDTFLTAQECLSYGLADEIRLSAAVTTPVPTPSL